MATTKTAAKTARNKLVPAPKAPSRDPRINPAADQLKGAVAVDKDVVSDGGVRAAPPTPTREHTEQTNEAGNTQVFPTATGSNGGEDPPDGIVQKRKVKSDMVTVIVPRAFNLTLDDHKQVAVDSGIQEMEREHADHWFSKAQGVEIYTGKKLD